MSTVFFLLALLATQLAPTPLSGANPEFAIAAQKKVCWLAYPRSGNHWAAYCLCHLLQKQGCMYGTSTAYTEFYGSNSGGYLYCAHRASMLPLSEAYANGGYLIVVVRNYRESMMRQLGSVDAILAQLQEERAFNLPNRDKQLAFAYSLAHYINHLRCYELWNPSLRCLIYYEDLLDRPGEVLLPIMQTFHIDNPEQRLAAFLRDLDSHKALTLAYYDRQGGAKSRGQDHLYHSKRMGSEACHLIDTTMARLFPYYYARYLSRYRLTTPLL